MEQHRHEAAPKISRPDESRVKVETPAAEATCQSSSSQTPTHTSKLSHTEQDDPRNKRKVCVFYPASWSKYNNAARELLPAAFGAVILFKRWNSSDVSHIDVIILN